MPTGRKRDESRREAEEEEGGKDRGVAAPAERAEELDEDEGKEEAMPTREGEWDDGEQRPGGRGELEEKNGEGRRAKDTRVRQGAGVATKGAGEKVDPAFGHRAEGDIHDRNMESDEILKVNGSDRNQERLREVATDRTWRSKKLHCPRRSPKKAVEGMRAGAGRSRLK